MKVHANVQVKNEEVLLSAVLPIWKEYPIDNWVFFDDFSQDKTVELIKDVLGDRATIFERKEHSRYTPVANREKMFLHSKSKLADYVVVLDADELLSSTMLTDFDELLKINSRYNVFYYSFDAVNSLNEHRVDGIHERNFKNIVIPVAHSSCEYDISHGHACRAPKINLQPVLTRDAGVIHLHTLSKRYYALKELYKKHRDFRELMKSVEDVNIEYDTIVNMLQFESEETPEKIVAGISFDSYVMDKAADKKKYKDYILKNKVEGLITFGEEHLV